MTSRTENQARPAFLQAKKTRFEISVLCTIWSGRQLPMYASTRSASRFISRVPLRAAQRSGTSSRQQQHLCVPGFTGASSAWYAFERVLLHTCHTASGYTASSHTASDYTVSSHTASGHTVSDYTALDYTASSHTASGYTALDYTASDYTVSDYTVSGHTASVMQ